MRKYIMLLNYKHLLSMSMCSTTKYEYMFIEYKCIYVCIVYYILTKIIPGFGCKTVIQTHNQNDTTANVLRSAQDCEWLFRM